LEPSYGRPAGRGEPDRTHALGLHILDLSLRQEDLMNDALAERLILLLNAQTDASGLQDQL
jgi:hypothetical protein